jgi:hypothetical protein
LIGVRKAAKRRYFALKTSLRQLMRSPIQKQGLGSTESQNWTICQNFDVDCLKAEVYLLGCHGLILERIPRARQISQHRSRYSPSYRIATAVVIVPNRDPGEIDLRRCQPQRPEIDPKFKDDDVTKLRVKHTAGSASGRGQA